MNPLRIGLIVIAFLVVGLVVTIINLKVEDAEEKKAAVRKRVIICIVAFFALFISYRIIYIKKTQGDTASSTEENCKLVHELYVKGNPTQRSFADMYLMDWDEYSRLTLYNLGLNSNRSLAKRSDLSNHDKSMLFEEAQRWNGTWIVTKDFIKQYVDMYSAEEFIQIYNLYILSYLNPVRSTADVPSGLYDKDKKFFEQNPQLLTYINETTQNLFELTETFDVVHYNPATDQVINKTSETETIRGSFNVGKDNHIETDTTELTTDTYEYDGYIVEHVYGEKYSKGDYGWRNGEFIDHPASFYSVDEYILRMPWGAISADSIDDLETSFIKIEDEKHYMRRIDGILAYPGDKSPDYFPQPVFILSDWDYNEHYIEYHH